MSNRKKLKPWKARPFAVQESPGTSTLSPLGISPQTVTIPAERAAVTEASIGGATVTSPGRMLIRLITAGMSLNMNAYPKDVLVQAARDRRFPRGLQCFIDHATDEEETGYPSGTIKNLAAVLTEDARWDEASQSLVAEARLFQPWRETLTDMADSIGMSIRAWVLGEQGEYENEECFVVSEIVEGRSCDFVTVPAAGGAILSVLEAVGNKVPTAEARNVGHWMESRIHADFTQRADDMFGDGRLTREERIVLSGAVGDALMAFAARIQLDAPQLLDRDIWQEPAEPVATVASEADAPTEPEPSADESATPPEPTAVEANEDVTDGAPPTALASTEQEPAMSGQSTGAPPVEAGTAPVVETPAVVTTESTQAAPVQPDFTAAIAEAIRAAQAPLLEQVQQMQAREAQRDAATRADQNRNRAREAVDAALRADDLGDVRAHIGPRVTGTVLATVPTTAEGAVDEAALATAVSAAITSEATFVRGLRAQALEDAGVGSVLGLGGEPAAEAEKDTSGVDEALKGLFETIGLTEQQTKVAVAGRN